MEEPFSSVAELWLNAKTSSKSISPNFIDYSPLQLPFNHFSVVIETSYLNQAMTRNKHEGNKRHDVIFTTDADLVRGPHHIALLSETAINYYYRA